MLKFLKFIIPCILLVACYNNKPKIKSRKGSIDIITNIYFEASKGLDSVKNYQVSNLSYQKNEIIELVPDLEYPQFINKVYFIKDTLCLDMGTIDQAKSTIVNDNKNKWFSVYKKNNGTVFFKGIVPLYSRRKDISDTVLFQKKYKRFEISDRNSFSRYYIYETDTIFPYSLNSQIDKDYNGRLERIDSYNKQEDIFVTVQLLPHKKIDSKAQDIFEFNQFANKRSIDNKKNNTANK